MAIRGPEFLQFGDVVSLETPINLPLVPDICCDRAVIVGLNPEQKQITALPLFLDRGRMVITRYSREIPTDGVDLVRGVLNMKDIESGIRHGLAREMYEQSTIDELIKDAKREWGKPGDRMVWYTDLAIIVPGNRFFTGA